MPPRNFKQLPTVSTKNYIVSADVVIWPLAGTERPETESAPKEVFREPECILNTTEVWQDVLNRGDTTGTNTG